ncbi:MAG: acyl carrier protein [Bacilli bacterium]|nr:acyl carrier protein [Bacilli bacterium]
MDTYERLKNLVKNQIKRKNFDINTVTPETTLESLGLDSLDAAELIINIEEEFELPEVTQEEMVEVSTVKDLVNLIQAKSGK